MATKRQTPTTTDQTVPPYTGSGDANQISSTLGVGAPPTASPSGITLQPAAPIGVPRYATDPDTGLIKTVDVPVTDANGAPVVDPKTGKPLTQKQYAPWMAPPPKEMVNRWQGAAAATMGVASGPPPGLTKPKYYEGDDVSYLNYILPEELWALQQDMAAAGVYGPKPSYLPGRADDSTVAAFRQVLTVANATGYDHKTALANWKQLSASAPKPPPPPHVTKLTPSADLGAVFNTAARSTLGRGLTKAERERYVAAYQAQESTYSDEAAVASEQGGTVTPPPDPSNYLSEQMQQNNPNEVAQYSLLNKVNAFRQMLAGPSLPTPGAG